MKDWFERLNGKLVETQQRCVYTGNLWVPGPRKVDTSRKTYVRLGNSIRDYRGMKVIEKTDTTLTVADKSHYIVYSTIR